MVLFPVDEIKRKSFHLLMLIYILAYWFLPRRFVLTGMGIAMGIVLLGEGLRLAFPAFNRRLLKCLGGVHRESETGKMSGLLWTLSGSFFTMLIFTDKKIVMAGFFYLAFGDTCAALCGRWLGRKKIVGEKTLEGSLACFLVCFVSGIFFLSWPMALLGAFLATGLELIPWPLNDNFWMPLVSSAMLTFFIHGQW